jgi:hypothetical protein
MVVEIQNTHLLLIFVSFCVQQSIRGFKNANLDRKKLKKTHNQKNGVERLAHVWDFSAIIVGVVDCCDIRGRAVCALDIANTVLRSSNKCGFAASFSLGHPLLYTQDVGIVCVF